MKKRVREIKTPEITPLIDVVFLLLIFFMVSTVFKKDELALLLDIPKTSKHSSFQNQKKSIPIELGAKAVAIQGKKLPFKEVAKFLEGIAKDKKRPIDLYIDKDVKYNRIIELLDILKQKELGQLSLITNSK